MPGVDLIIPALNEEANIGPLLAALPREQLRHVILCDNGSTDRTVELARASLVDVVIVDAPSRGYGSACLAGLAWIAAQNAPPDVVAFIDADLSDDPALLPDIVGPILRGEADLVIASRPRLAEPGALTTPQRFGNRLATTLIRLGTGQRFTDLGPMRAVRYASLQTLNMQDRTWGWTVEMQYKAGLAKLRCVEIDVPYRCRAAGKSKISGTIAGSVRAGVKILSILAVLWLRGLRTRE